MQAPAPLLQQLHPSTLQQQAQFSQNKLNISPIADHDAFDGLHLEREDGLNAQKCDVTAVI